METEAAETEMEAAEVEMEVAAETTVTVMVRTMKQ
jgi:hypothetical protein